jgi:hypothetical protein
MELTIKQLDIIAHSLGINLFNAILSDKNKDKILPNEFYRNYYCISDENSYSFQSIKELITYNLMEKFSDGIYIVTELGKLEFIQHFHKLVIYKPLGERDENYLKHKINAYCNFYNYKFCEDNSEHIISYFKNYYLLGYKVSFTTLDVINRFKKDLKKLYKKQKV